MSSSGADAVVVGGGIVGLCSALHLQRRGYEVTVIDRGPPGTGASGHNAGLFSIGNCLPTATPGVIRSVPKMLLDPSSPLAIRWRYLPRLTPWLLRFLAASRPGRVEQISVAIAGLQHHAVRAFADLLPMPDPDAGLYEGGHLLAYGSEAAFSKAAYGLEVRRARGIPVEVLDPSGVASLYPALSGRISHGVLVPDSYYFDPPVFTAAVAARFTHAGGRWLEQTVRDFRIKGDRISAVETDEGRLGASLVVIAAGAWSRSLVRILGFDTPLDTERGYGVRIPDPGIELGGPLIYMDRHVGITPVPGRLLLAGTDELAGLRAPPNYARAEALIRAARELFPDMNTDGAEKWMSFRPSHPDSLPVIGRSPRQENVYLAYGHGHLGFTMGAITGEMIGQLADAEDTTVELEPFRPTRFRMMGRRRPLINP
ncbi:MAG: FAD-dependent oxidoreductase [bacterium]|nr:FAD-dependent oxidoreductase [bacterium]MDE0601145.1 FAD-dependent oxidoreductase [bacterium]